MKTKETLKPQDTQAHTPSANRVVMSSHVGQALENPTMHMWKI